MAAGKGGARRRVGSISSPADLMPAVPFTAMMKRGELYLADEQLRFTVGNEVLLDAPTEEIHSVSPAVMGLHVWHGSTRYRFALGSRDRTAPPSSRANAVTAMWMEALTPLVGEPPSGLHVRPPWPRWAWLLSVVVLSAFFITVALILVHLKN